VVLPALPAARDTVIYEDLVETARRDENVLGLVLTGSRATGVGVAESSDWDVRLIVPDELRDRYRDLLATPHGAEVEVVVLGITDLERAGAVGTTTAWDRYSWVRAQVVVDDENGLVAEIVERKRALTAEEARTLAAEHLDDYVNWLYRSLKNDRSGLTEGARLDAAESVSSLLGFLFAVHGRVRPFNRQLRSELEAHPFPGKPWSAEALLPLITEILSTAAGDSQRAVFRDVEILSRAHGLGDVLDSWEPDLGWLRGTS
jgi:hypothetical protein